ncbi:hypothetical protein PO909_014181, partial [Leuciscus waleckii]
FDIEHFLCFRVGCQGQEPSPTDATDQVTDSTANQAVVTSTVSVINTATVLPTLTTTTEVKAQTTPEPYKPSSGYTTQRTAPSETDSSGNSKSTLITSPPAQPETAASNNYLDKIKETVNPASNQESRQSESKINTEEKGTSGSSPAVFVSVLMAGLLLAAIIVGIYYFKCHRRTNGKGIKLAEESYMADEENQGNTLVSVAPLNQPEPQEKPSLNGESQEAVKPQTPPAATNGHSTTKTADTEL